jgi:TonB family protein
MAERLSFLIPLVLSLMIHSLVIGAGEVLSRRSVSPQEGGNFQVEYALEGATVNGREPPAEPEESVSAGSISLETPDPRYGPYFQRITRAIDSFWDEPLLREKDPREGSLVVEFTLGRAGELLAVSVASSSGVRGMDLAAVRAVKMAAPFEKFPSAIEAGELSIRALFVYD